MNEPSLLSFLEHKVWGACQHAPLMLHAPPARWQLWIVTTRVQDQEFAHAILCAIAHVDFIQAFSHLHLICPILLKFIHAPETRIMTEHASMQHPGETKHLCYSLAKQSTTAEGPNPSPPKTPNPRQRTGPHTSQTPKSLRHPNPQRVEIPDQYIWI